MYPLHLPLRKMYSIPLLFGLMAVILLFQITAVASRAQAKTETTTISAELIKAIDEIFPPPPDTESNSSPNERPQDPDVPNENLNSELSNCNCVAFYLCQNDTIITNGDGIIDIRIQPDNPCKFSFEKCCNKRKDVSKKNDETKLKNDENNIPKCGQWNQDGVGLRIVGDGKEAQIGEFPWMVAILHTEDNKVTNVGGGSLIHPKVVLTAVHIVHKKELNDLLVRAGEWDTQSENENYKHQDRAVSKIIKHEQYLEGPVYNDIALVVVSKPFILGANVGTICLPPQSYVFPSDPRCYASGWGKNSFGKAGSYQNILKKIDLPVVQHDMCLEELRKTRLGEHFKLHESFICAGGEFGIDTCTGDGGSPLMCPIEGKSNQLQQAGIVAWGIGCGETTPGVYVNVARFRLWIDHQILHLQLSPFYYDASYDRSKQSVYNGHLDVRKNK